ncbi:hypothetical protein BDB00DRAFT_874052 [Zychaea mexicana]|uniref:uncharacterized protein n=1 Tax=Zychaea mexicana TaxID=64656 RepID=UPI0022FEC348|nr:uncharacterized protein BDB00DRAFT_874052 [Zychaea mexicana]KAI9491668.1 hypothetical protein BDB00DRAFT_874052 [Zychaea mexicana]
MTPSAIDCFSASKKRKNDEVTDLKTAADAIINNDSNTAKRQNNPATQPIQTGGLQQPVFTESYFMPNQSQLPPRSTTPPLSMTLAHYNANSQSYATSVVRSAEEQSTAVCSGMTPVYRPAAERWGSSFL